MSHLFRFAVLLTGLSLAKPLWAEESSQTEAKPVEKSTDEAASKADDKAAEVAAGHSLHGEAFDDGPRQHAYLMEGTGKINFPASTKNDDVRAFINQGVGQLHGFWYFEAERSFREAAMREPDCAIAYWGMAMANINNDKRAKGFIAEAVKRKDKASDHERRYIDALDAYWKADPKKKPDRNAAYIKALEDLLYEYPDDLDAKAWMVMTQWQASREGTKIDNYLAVDALISEILAKEPMHPVHHYRIHLWDDKRAAKALQSAALCGPAAPGIAHMWHMPGHTYSKQKRYRDAAWQQEASARVDHAYMMRDHVMPDQIHNFAHNNEWLIRDLMNIGSWKKALGLAENMISLPMHPKYNSDQKPGSNFYGRQRLPDVLEKYELWQQTIELADSGYFPATDSVPEKTARLRALGRAYLNQGERAKGNEQLELLRSMLAQQQADREKAEEAAQATINDEAAKEAAKLETANLEAAKADAKKEVAEVKTETGEANKLIQEAKQGLTDIQQEAATLKQEAKLPEENQKKTPASATDENKTSGCDHTDEKEEKPADEVSATSPQADKPSDSKPADSKPVELEADQKTEKKPATDQSSEADKQPADGKKPEPEKKANAADDLKKRIETARKNAAKPFQSKIANLELAIAELEGWSELADGHAKEAVKLLEKAKIDSLALARVQLAAGNEKEADKIVRREARNRTSEVLPLAAMVEVLWKCGQRKDAYDTFEQLRQLSSTIDLDCPVFARLAPIAKEFGFTEDWRLSRELPADLGPRPPLDTLGPTFWQPFAAPQWTLTDADGVEHSLKQYEGKPVLVLFYLGYGCIHCAEQLQVFGPMTNDFAAAGISLVAISTDNRDGLTKSLAQCEGGKFPFPLISDVDLNVFKAYKVYDDFEQQPLHATMLIDAHGQVRWQDISYEPFKDAKFVLEESKRLLALPSAQ